MKARAHEKTPSLPGASDRGFGPPLDVPAASGRFFLSFAGAPNEREIMSKYVETWLKMHRAIEDRQRKARAKFAVALAADLRRRRKP